MEPAPTIFVCVFIFGKKNRRRRGRPCACPKGDMRHIRYFVTAFYILFSVCFAGVCAPGAAADEISVSATCAMVAEIENGRILFAKNAGERFPPASTAKVMTAIIAIENFPPDKEFSVSRRASRTEPVIAGLKVGVRYNLRDLLTALIVKSANDAAVVIAEGIAGDEKKFTLLMNAKAAEIGMRDTYFATASGLPAGRPDSQYTTVEDLVRMMRYALRHGVILDMLSKKEAEIYGSDGRRIRLKSHNKTFSRPAGVSWGKTGYTREAKRTFVGVDPSFSPHVILALLQSADLWDDISELKQKGLALYERNHRTPLSAILAWVKYNRQKS